MFNWLRKLFTPLLRIFWSFLKVIFRGTVEIILAQLRELAITTVLEIAADPSLITDEAKRKEAFERLKERAIAKGIDARDSAINLSIELALQYLKQEGRL